MKPIAGTEKVQSEEDAWIETLQPDYRPPVVHLSFCASQDDTMAGYPNCDCGAGPFLAMDAAPGMGADAPCEAAKPVVSNEPNEQT